MIACCGLVCSNCPTFLATKNDDDVAREKTAALYAKLYGFNLKPEEINCDGCLTTGGRQIGYCQTCGIKQCCGQKGLENCAYCTEQQQCEKIKSFHKFSPEAKSCFEALKKEIGTL
ncbi:DUF3795 domain-containing protein [Desulfotruncus arcticus]|nr:DUF3795 domain-containing protein [Desulfotruncus arcticus]